MGKGGEKKRRGDWQANHHNLRKAISSLFRKLHRMPTHQELAEECGLTEETVRRHIESIQFNPAAIDRVERVLADDLVSAMLMAGLSGKVQAAKLWLKLTGLYDDKAETRKGGGINPMATGEKKVVMLPRNGRDEGK